MTDSRNSCLPITVEQGRALAILARQAIMEKLGKKVPAKAREAIAPLLAAPCLQEKWGTFICLKINGQLRGCIGSLTATESIVEGVRHNAVNAAFEDPRFPPLAGEELESIKVEVSVLTAPRPLEYTDGEDLAARLVKGEDGLIIRKGIHSATFLPQVWEQLPDPRQFLSHLCQKAGLAGDAWQREKLSVQTYRVQYFTEYS